MSALRLHLGLVYLFLYAPIATLMVLSLNATGLPTVWGGLSVEWYGKLAGNAPVLAATRNSLIVAAASTAIATVIGTALAIGAELRARSRLLDALMLAPMIVPDIVLAIALLSFFTLMKLTLGLHSIVLAHVVFNIAFVAAVVRVRLTHLDRATLEASEDLGASDWTTLTRVLLPQIGPGVLAGALLAFTLSLDEFIIAYFVAGPGSGSTTLPMQIFAMIRFGVTPEINAMATILIGVSFALVLAAQRLDRGALQR